MRVKRGSPCISYPYYCLENLPKLRDGTVLKKERHILKRWKEYFEQLLNEENERQMSQDEPRLKGLQIIHFLPSAKTETPNLGYTQLLQLRTECKMIYEMPNTADQIKLPFHKYCNITSYIIGLCRLVTLKFINI